eukprot:scaffold11071_cov50-Phaeocystis_antarctica.AAC.1
MAHHPPPSPHASRRMPRVPGTEPTVTFERGAKQQPKACGRVAAAYGIADREGAPYWAQSPLITVVCGAGGKRKTRASASVRCASLFTRTRAIVAEELVSISNRATGSQLDSLIRDQSRAGWYCNTDQHAHAKRTHERRGRAPTGGAKPAA